MGGGTADNSIPRGVIREKAKKIGREEWGDRGSMSGVNFETNILKTIVTSHQPD